MNYQEQVIRMTESARQMLFKSARAMPADKSSWTVLDKGRTALDQLQESAQSPLLFLTILKDRRFPDLSEEDMATHAEQRQQWQTIEDCERACQTHCSELFDCIRALPDEALSESVSLPWGEATLADVAMYQYWNQTYHLGQINFIQTLYGDQEMHV